MLATAYLDVPWTPPGNGVCARADDTDPSPSSPRQNPSRFKSLEPSAVGATKKPSKHRGLSRIRPALSHLVPHPKTFGRAQEVQWPVLPSGARCWVQRLVIGGRRRELGLGGFPLVSLAEAREAALG